MKKKNQINAIAFLISIAIPTISSAIATKHTSVALLIFAIGMLLMLKIPVFKHRENLWMFAIASFATIPINIPLVKMICQSSVLANGRIASDIFKSIVVYALLFSVEQIVLGILTRLFYRRQYKLFKEEGEE